MARPTIKNIAIARAKAAGGVDYSPRFGATCPWCGRRAKIYKTTPWEDNTRIRYHRCSKAGCVLATMNISIKSIEANLIEKENV